MKQNVWKTTVFLFAMVAFSLWLALKCILWNQGVFNFPIYDLEYMLKYSNKPYIVSAGLPIMAYFLLSLLPEAIQRVFPKYRKWNGCYVAVVAVLLTAATVCMLAATRISTDTTGIGNWIFSSLESKTMFKIVEVYCRSIDVFLPLSLLAFLVILVAKLIKMDRKQLVHTGERAKRMLRVSVLIGIANPVISLCLLRIAEACGLTTADWVYRFAVANASDFNAAWVSIASAPIVEEIAFRGVICGKLEKVSNRWTAIFISAIFFGIWHRNLAQFAYTMPHGIVYGYLFLATGSVAWPMVVHCVNNLVVILAYSNKERMVFGTWPLLNRLREWLLQLPLWGSVLLLALLIAWVVFVLRKIRTWYSNDAAT